MNWRVAKSLDQLLRQVNALYPNRDKSSDGSIGDAAHASRNSDHNPYIKDRDGVGVVRARDFTNDPIHGLLSEELAQKLIASRDDRIRYIISNRKIASGPAGPQSWSWRKYAGTNPHDHHCHVSVREEQKFYDDVAPWRFDMQRAPLEVEQIVTPVRPVLRLKAVGNDVKILQALLVKKAKSKIMVDGEFGQATERAVTAFQQANNLVADGVVGPYTWKALEA